MEIVVLGNKNTVKGFRLAGVKKCIEAADSLSELHKQFNQLINEESTGILLVDNCCQPLREEIIRHSIFKSKPIVIDVPCKGNKITPEIFESITKIATGAK